MTDRDRLLILIGVIRVRGDSARALHVSQALKTIRLPLVASSRLSKHARGRGATQLGRINDAALHAITDLRSHCHQDLIVTFCTCVAS